MPININMPNIIVLGKLTNWSTNKKLFNTFNVKKKSKFSKLHNKQWHTTEAIYDYNSYEYVTLLENKIWFDDQWKEELVPFSHIEYHK